METQPMIAQRNANWGSYIVAFFITAFIFATALYASNYFNNQRITEIRAAQDDISTDILSLETQFDLLQEHSCSDIGESTILPSELSALGNQLSYMESQGLQTRDEVTRLKRLYSLLEIKDYLLMKQLAEKCKLKPVFILYFYSNTGDCPDCERQGYTLTALSREYPQLRIYSFDYHLGVSALQTLVSIADVSDNLPALYIGGKTYYGYHSIEDIGKILPELKTLEKATGATTTARKK